MPRNYKPNPDSRAYNKDADSENLKKAAADVTAKRMSRRKACREYGIGRTKLTNYLQMREGKKLYRRPGGQTIISPVTERAIVNHLLAVSQWGFPFDLMDLRMLVKSVLDKDGVIVDKLKDNFPGEDWAQSFMKRHSDQIKTCMCQNVSRKRVGLSVEVINQYFTELAQTLEGVPSQNVINYHEMNLTRDPCRKHAICKRGVRYPKVHSGIESVTSLMLAGSAAGDVLPFYVVYKNVEMQEGGPPKARYNQSMSGWFDNKCFHDWFLGVVLPYCSKLPGKKVIIGDYLSSHFSDQIIQECADNNITFVCLPPNSTHLCQPLYVAYFGPMKTKWRSILKRWKQSGRKNAGTVPKNTFPKLLRELMSELPNQKENLMEGFSKCGIHPLDPTPVLDRLPKTAEEIAAGTEQVHSSVHLRSLRNGNQESPRGAKRRRVDDDPGKSIDTKRRGRSNSYTTRTPEQQPLVSVLATPRVQNLKLRLKKETFFQIFNF